jgi:hypothetical protein
LTQKQQAVTVAQPVALMAGRLESVSVLYGSETDIVALFEARHGGALSPVSAAPPPSTLTPRSTLAARDERPVMFAAGPPPPRHAKEDRARGAPGAHEPTHIPLPPSAHGGPTRVPRLSGGWGGARGRRLVAASSHVSFEAGGGGGAPGISYHHPPPPLAPDAGDGGGGSGGGSGLSARARLRSDRFRTAGDEDLTGDGGGVPERNVRSAHDDRDYGAGGGLPPRPPLYYGPGDRALRRQFAPPRAGSAASTSASAAHHRRGGGALGREDLRTLSHAAAHFLVPADQRALALCCHVLARAHGRRVGALRVTEPVTFRGLRDALSTRFTHVRAIAGVGLGPACVREVAAALPAAGELSTVNFDGARGVDVLPPTVVTRALRAAVCRVRC